MPLPPPAHAPAVTAERTFSDFLQDIEWELRG